LSSRPRTPSSPSTREGRFSSGTPPPSGFLARSRAVLSGAIWSTSSSRSGSARPTGVGSRWRWGPAKDACWGGGPRWRRCAPTAASSRWRSP
jgi:hypothetical protein